MSSFVGSATTGPLESLRTALTNALDPNSGTPTPDGATRVPFEFTSTLRLLTRGDGGLPTRGQSSQAQLTLQRLQEQVTSSVRNVALASKDQSNQMTDALPRIQMAINPNTFKINPSKRISRLDTSSGTVFHHFTDPVTGQNEDVYTIAFSGNSGNINQATPNGLYKLQLLTNLFQLTREPPFLADGTKNVMYVYVQTNLFPTGIRFSGFWSRTFDPVESARKPNSKDYTMEFTITGSTPDLNEIARKTNLTNVITQVAQVK